MSFEATMFTHSFLDEALQTVCRSRWARKTTRHVFATTFRRICPVSRYSSFSFVTALLWLHFFSCSIYFSFRCHLTDHPTGKAIWRAISSWMTKNAPYILLLVVPCFCGKQLCQFIRTLPRIALREIRRSSCYSGNSRPHGIRQRILSDHSEALKDNQEHPEITRKHLDMTQKQDQIRILAPYLLREPTFRQF